MGTTTASNTEFQDAGKPIANPVYIVDANGKVILLSLLTARLVSAASINATNIKTSAGILYGYTIANQTASTFEFVKFWNKASAPVPASDAALLTWTVGIHGSTTETVMFPQGIPFTIGISYATTLNPTDTDATAVGANDIVMSILYA